jgi:glycosyltransferase involved in cell wall biosynthesis
MNFSKKNKRIMSKKPRVTFYYRKPRKVGNYSVEFIFRDVAERLKDRIIARTATSHFESTGLFKRLYNTLEAVFRQGDVNHITGDVHFIGIFLKKRKTIQTVLDCGQLKASTGFKHAIYKYFWFSLPIRRCTYVTAISTATKNEILKYIDCDPDKIFVIPVAISEKFTRVDRAFNKTNPRLLQIGTAPNKNMERLIEALEGIPCTLVIIGKQNYEYENKMKALGISYSYMSGLTDDEMRNQYQEADIITLASTYEGFGMPILEAQSVGRAVLTSNITSMPEVAGDAACIIDPYQTGEIRNGILKIIHEDEYRKGLVEKGFENIKRYNPERIALDYYELYKKISE